MASWSCDFVGFYCDTVKADDSKEWSANVAEQRRVFGLECYANFLENSLHFKGGGLPHNEKLH